MMEEIPSRYLCDSQKELAALSNRLELALAMQRSAVSAQDSKVSMEQLIAMVGTVSSVTRREASSVGEAFKTMFSRFKDIQQGAIDEEGVDINYMEKALGRVGIAIRHLS